MKDRKESLSTHRILKELTHVAIGTGGGTIAATAARGLTFSTEYATYLYAKRDNTKSLFQIYRDVHRFDSLCKLPKVFRKTGFWQTIGKSLSTVGVAHCIKTYHSDLTSAQQVLVSTGVGSVLETLFTARGESNKVGKFLNLDNEPIPPGIRGLFTIKFARALSATFMRVLPTTFITNIAIFPIANALTQFVPEQYKEKSLTTGVITAIATASIQGLNMPFVNFQTHAYSHSDKSLWQTTQQFFKDYTIKHAFRGTKPRMINRGLFYGTAFMLVTTLQEQVDSIMKPKCK